MDAERFLHQIGPSTRAELLAALTAPEEESAARIGRLHARADAHLVAAAVILKEDFDGRGIRSSKKMRPSSPKGARGAPE